MAFLSAMYWPNGMGLQANIMCMVLNRRYQNYCCCVVCWFDLEFSTFWHVCLAPAILNVCIDLWGTSS